MNDASLTDGSRILSAYPIDPAKPSKGYDENTLWIITEADRSVTTFWVFFLRRCRASCLGALPLSAPQGPSAHNATKLPAAKQWFAPLRVAPSILLRSGSPRRPLRLAHPGLADGQRCSSSCTSTTNKRENDYEYRNDTP